VRRAAESEGIVARAWLLADGVTRRQIDRRTRDGRLQQIYADGIYAVGHRALRPRAYRIAAVLAGGRDAVLSHRSAADAHGLLDRPPVRHEVIAPLRRRRREAPIVVYRAALHDDEWELLDGVPTTTVARTLLDLAATCRRSIVDRALEAAERRRILDLADVRAVLARNRGRRGVATLRDAVERLHPATGDTRSRLEALALRLVTDHGLPQPAVNVLVDGKEVDLLWPHDRLVAELDGRETHLTPQAFERDRRRDAELAAAGYRVLRFTWRQLTEDPAFVAAALRAALRAAPRPATPAPAPASAAA
jgi:hypothetical protein